MTNSTWRTAAVLFFVLIALSPHTARAADRPPPWHLVDVWWDLGADVKLERFGLDVTIEGDVPADVPLYVAPIGLGKLGGTPFYGGIQTQSDGHTKRDRRLRKLGPGLLMSMWNERNLDAIRPSDGGFCQSSGHEGDFVSVRRPYAWKPGRYRYEIVRMDREESDGKPFTWVGGQFVHTYAADENVFIGALRFPGEGLVLQRRVASFVEIYGRPIPVDRIPKLTVTFGNFVANGKPIQVASATARYPDGVPDYATTEGRDGGVVVRTGEPVADRQQREVRLLPEAAK